MFRDAIGVLGAAVLALAWVACGDDDPAPPASDASDAADVAHELPGPPTDSGPETPDPGPETPDADASADAADTPAPPEEYRCARLQRPPAAYRLVLAFPGLPELPEPVALVPAPAAGTTADSRWFLIERAGRVRAFPNTPGASKLTTVLDITDHTDSSGESGLVALDLHPLFETNGQAYVAYTAVGGTVMLSRVSRFHSVDDGETLDPGSEEVLFEVDQTDPTRIHLSADLHFGPDGLLYFALGDGGPQGDPFEHAQDPWSPKGKVLRIDVNSGVPYAIPPDNPFAAGGGAPEVYALGVRSPWRFRFDAKTGDLWLGDVGWDRREEVNRITLGGNYGWNVFEGTECVDEEAGCALPGSIEPVHQYDHEAGASVTGGTVYRGEALPALEGRYVFADFISGFVWALPVGAQPGDQAEAEVLVDSGYGLVSVAEDAEGELYFVDLLAGRLFRLEAGDDVATARPFPPTLAETGCTDPADVTAVAPWLVPYELNVPAWNNGATARRFLSLPESTIATLDPAGRLELPTGTVLLQELSVAGVPVETRLQVRHQDGEWAGYSYAWDATGSTTTLLPIAAKAPVVAIGGATWTYATRAQCRTCHKNEAGHPAGLETLQLNRPAPPEAGAINQLDHLVALGVLDALPAPADELGALPSTTGDASVSHRARALLHANCSICHRTPPIAGGMDMRYGTALAEMGVCGEEPTYGDADVEGSLIVFPGEAEKSVLWLRFSDLEAGGMPPAGKTVIDEPGVTLLGDWITSLASCPNPGPDPF